jgi:hypothetical protein
MTSARPQNFDRPWSPAPIRRETPAATIASEPAADGAISLRDATPNQDDIEADQ